MPTRFPVAKGAVRLCGAIVDADEVTGQALAVRRVSELVEEEDWKGKTSSGGDNCAESAS